MAIARNSISRICQSINILSKKNDDAGGGGKRSPEKRKLSISTFLSFPFILFFSSLFCRLEFLIVFFDFFDKVYFIT